MTEHEGQYGFETTVTAETISRNIADIAVELSRLVTRVEIYDIKPTDSPETLSLSERALKKISQTATDLCLLVGVELPESRVSETLELSEAPESSEPRSLLDLVATSDITPEEAAELIKILTPIAGIQSEGAESAILPENIDSSSATDSNTELVALAPEDLDAGFVHVERSVSDPIETIIINDNHSISIGTEKYDFRVKDGHNSSMFFLNYLLGHPDEQFPKSDVIDALVKAGHPAPADGNYFTQILSKSHYYNGAVQKSGGKRDGYQYGINPTYSIVDARDTDGVDAVKKKN